MNYYNEFDPKAAAWLRELIKEGHIPNGEVDTRSIVDVQPADLRGFVQCHFFAGISGWSLALQLAGWPSTEPVWTGSCPCQPFSVAGKGKGTEDERHLWPVFAELIRACKPPVAFGEQVASKAGREWLAGVFADLEGMGYQRAGADLCAPCAAKPHLRKRLYWVADANLTRGPGTDLPRFGRTCEGANIRGAQEEKQERYRRFDELVSMGVGERVASYSEARSLLHGIPERLAIMRGTGNAIVPEVAAQFIRAYLES